MYRRRRWAHRVTDDAHTPPAPPINAIADAFVEEYEALDPVPAAEYGVPRHEHGSPTCPPTASPPARSGSSVTALAMLYCGSKSAYRDGTTHMVMSPLEFMQRLAALVPRPRLHLIRFHGVLAPHAGLRAAIVPGPAQNTSEPADEHAHGAPARLGWARLLKRVFEMDLEHCPHCGGALKVIAAIEEPAVIVGILTHLQLARSRPAAIPGAGIAAVPGGLIRHPKARWHPRPTLAGRGSRSTCVRPRRRIGLSSTPTARVRSRPITPKSSTL